MEEANRPVTVNSLMARKAAAIKQNAPAENMLTQYAQTMPQNWQQFVQNLAQAYPTPATGGTRDQILSSATNLAKSVGPQMINTLGLPNRGADLIQGKAEELAGTLRKQGFDVKVEHSGSIAGPSSYVSVYDPVTGRYIKDPARFSGHSKGAKESQFIHEITDDSSSVQKFIDLANSLRGMGPSELMKKSMERK